MHETTFIIGLATLLHGAGYQILECELFISFMAFKVCEVGKMCDLRSDKYIGLLLVYLVYLVHLVHSVNSVNLVNSVNSVNLAYSAYSTYLVILVYSVYSVHSVYLAYSVYSLQLVYSVNLVNLVQSVYSGYNNVKGDSNVRGDIDIDIDIGLKRRYRSGYQSDRSDQSNSDIVFCNSVTSETSCYVKFYNFMVFDICDAPDMFY